MIKIQIVSLGTNFVEIKYNDFASNFGVANRVLNKSTVDMTLIEDKSKIIICFSDTNFSITLAILAYIDTTATTIEDYYNELKALL